ncbi:hypothetical protein NEOLEDRAFT_1055280 [Neolentinus lepideus HHB14362 ss-1]|uniref:Uncharacterized protein n=1 Tax=Neolentinus lepideus HHB14362 ss-1 TaxID=1314782 RepID=A0A165VK60_9AGAM|nr:hypothetical protein NEOLEDRAFT_1055280 [Neolentinus lepideus HHB14362 ss-1]
MLLTILHASSLHLYVGTPCDEHGSALKPGAPPPVHPTAPPTDWFPYCGRGDFEIAEFLFKEEQMSGNKINRLMELWSAKSEPPFHNAQSLYSTIDSTTVGDVEWDAFSVKYQGDVPEGEVPDWMTASYDVYYRDPHQIAQRMLSNPDYSGEIDYCAIQESLHGEPRLKDFMSGAWAWRHSNMIAQDKATHGSMFVPVILGSDKTTVSVGTGDNEYYPLYMMLGNHHNGVRRAHRDAVAVIGFLAIPKTDRAHKDDVRFRKFRRQIFHSSIGRILQSLKPGMTTPEVTLCADGHFRRAIYGLGPYIADYPEQALLACIVQGWCPKCTGKSVDLDGGGTRRTCEHTEQLIELLDLGTLWTEYGIVGDVVPFTNDFPRADIHELLSPDLLHQLIKGVFKDHLVEWIVTYLISKNGKARGEAVLTEIDDRIAVVPPFTGLRRFPQGRGFKQWTGDDSKALMKVYLPAIDGLLPQDIVRTVRAFLEFCYIARRDVHTRTTIQQLHKAKQDFHIFRTIFQTTGVRSEGFSLPRQHSVEHYEHSIWEYAAPNGLCSSITESKHIKAVKEPWRRSNRFEALGQMLVTNQRLDKISASRVDFVSRGMLQDKRIQLSIFLMMALYQVQDRDTSLSFHQNHVCIYFYRIKLNIGRQHSRDPTRISENIDQLTFHTLLRQFLASHYNLTDESLPNFNNPISIHYSAKATYFAPSDPSGIGGMHSEHIRATPHWRKGDPRFDCVLVRRLMVKGTSAVSQFDIGRVFLFFSFQFGEEKFQCALIHWFDWVGDAPDADTGMWIVERCTRQKDPLAIIPVQRILRAAHLIPVYGEIPVPKGLTQSNSLDMYPIFFVNKFADHQAFDLFH